MSTDDRTPPKRFRAGDVIENLQHTIEALTSKTAEPYVSVEFTRNAKGETQISTKVSAPGGTDPQELTELGAMVLGEAQTLYERSTWKYPSATGFVTNDGPPKGREG